MKIIKFLVVYLPFEVFLLKWLPVNEQVYMLLRQVPDLLVFSLMTLLLVIRTASGRKIPIIGGKVDLFLSLFVGWAFITLVINSAADTIVGIANIKALLRYVLLVYILLILNPSQKQINSLLSWFSLVIAIQILIGLFQLVGGISVRDFLAARHLDEGLAGFVKDFTGDKFEGVNDLMGTMGDTISFAYFMLIGLCLRLFMFGTNNLRAWSEVIVLFALVYLSGSRAITLAAMLMIFGYLVWLKGWGRLFVLAIPILPIVITVVGLFLYSGTQEIGDDPRAFSFMFTEEYVQGALNQRLGIMVYIVPKIMFSAQNLFGFSPDKEFFAEFVSDSLPMVPTILIAVLPHVLEDVYWVAIYIYYGLIGFLFWILFLRAIYKRVKKSHSKLLPGMKSLSCVVLALIMISIPLNFLNQAFEARAFSFYLWLFCGLALVQSRRIYIPEGTIK